MRIVAIRPKQPSGWCGRPGHHFGGQKQAISTESNGYAQDGNTLCAS
jgi:hypothetical protein